MTHPLLQRSRAALYSPWFVPLSLLGLCLLVMGDVLIGRRGVISASYGDISYYFIYSRQYAFTHLREGHIPQWDPYIYSGTPFFGGWQAGVLYPPNWLYLVLGLKAALVLDVFLSTFMAGLFTSLIAAKYGFHPVARLLAGTIVMFSGAFFAHVWPGHLSALAAMAWTPLAVLAVDELIDRPHLRSALMGMGAVAMQVLAGHPQTVFNTAFTIAVYALIRMIRAPHKPAIAISLVSTAVGGALIAAVQLLTGIQVASEGVRTAATTYSFVTQFSFPPENILTLLAPQFFGNLRSVDYWGRSYYWEAGAFVGIATLVLAIAGYHHGTSDRRRLWLTMALLLFVVALGKHTPVFSVLYRIVPGFASFRSPNRFIYESTLFVALLASAGLDAILRGAKVSKAVISAAWAIAATAAACAVLARMPSILHMLLALRNSNEPGRHIYLATLSTPACDLARTSLELATGVALIVAICSSLCRCSSRWRYALALIAFVELVSFARTNVTTFKPEVSYPPALREWYRQHPGNYRVLQRGDPPNSAIGLGTCDIWGYDPVAQYRYVELLTASQHRDVNNPSIDMLPDYWTDVFSILGCRYILIAYEGGEVSLPVARALPLVSVVYDYDVLPSRQLIFDTLTRRSFDGSKTVVLESPPQVATAQPALPPLVKLTWLTTDSMEVDVTTQTPGILLVNETYSRFWRATALPGSAQHSYAIQPGDYTQMALPIQAGRHRILLRYQPTIFVPGALISTIALVAFLVVCGIELRRRPEDRTQ